MIKLHCADRDPFKNVSERYQVVIYSQSVPANGIRDILGKSYQSGSVIIYLLLVLLLAFVCRDKVFSGLDGKWIQRVDVPQRLYRKLMAIHLCRDAGDMEREEQLVGEFLDLFRRKGHIDFS
jgi:hypothetical protein